MARGNYLLADRHPAAKPTAVEEWTEKRAIAAREKNRQVMIPGLREQAQEQRVFVAHEFAQLKGLVLGNPESMHLPDPYHPSWYTSFRSLPGTSCIGSPPTAASTPATWIPRCMNSWMGSNPESRQVPDQGDGQALRAVRAAGWIARGPRQLSTAVLRRPADRL